MLTFTDLSPTVVSTGITEYFFPLSDCWEIMAIAEHVAKSAVNNGNVNFDEVFRLLKENNYKENFILQAARGKDDIQTAKDQLNFIKVFISKYFQWI